MLPNGLDSYPEHHGAEVTPETIILPSIVPEYVPERILKRREKLRAEFDALPDSVKKNVQHFPEDQF